jgi:hypothetical protein
MNAELSRLNAPQHTRRWGSLALNSVSTLLNNPILFLTGYLGSKAPEFAWAIPQSHRTRPS